MLICNIEIDDDLNVVKLSTSTREDNDSQTKPNVTDKTPAEIEADVNFIGHLIMILDNYVKELEKNNLEKDEESDDSQEESE